MSTSLNSEQHPDEKPETKEEKERPSTRFLRGARKELDEICDKIKEVADTQFTRHTLAGEMDK